MAIRSNMVEDWRDRDAAVEVADDGADGEPIAADEAWEPAQERAELVPAVLLGLAAAIWTGLVAWRAAVAPAPTVEQALAGVAVLCAPLALLGLLYLLVRRTSRREAHRFGRTAAAMRAEAAALDAVLAKLSARIDDNRRALADQAQQLLLLGEDATARIGAISGAMSVETATLAAQTDRLELAARGARGDVAMLLQDLPRATAESRELGQLLRDAGVGAHSQAAALEGALAALAGSARAVEESAGGGAQRLAAHIARIESAAAVAGERLDATAAGMTATIETALAAAAGGIDEARRGIDAQGAAMQAMVEQGRAAVDQAGAEAARAFAARLDEIGAGLERLGAGLATHGEAGAALTQSLDEGVTRVERRLAGLVYGGTERTLKLNEAMAALGDLAEGVEKTLGRAGQSGDALIGRADLLGRRLRESAAALNASLPNSFDQLDARLARSRAALATVAPKAAELAAAAGEAVARLGDADAALGQQSASVTAVSLAAEERVTTLRGQVAELDAALAGGGEQVRRLIESTGPQLVEALVRVRETARAAADHARETIATVIPGAADALGEAAGAALRSAVNHSVEERVAEVAAAGDRAAEAAQRASERLTRQLVTIADTTGLIEARLAEARTELAEADEEAFGPRVALLIEALNSTAIDVTGILSQEIADGAWAAYLKGDRGVFTRRAVRLLGANEARAIQRLYDADTGFRDQLNRYVHDFEALLRRILGGRDGASLGVTLLSSDMGKLYVALAQAIDRLKT